MNKSQINTILQSAEAMSIIESNDFYFRKGQDVLQQWVDMQVSDDLKNELLKLSKDYKRIQDVANENQEIKSILELLFKIVSYCDDKAKDKHFYNAYEDKRCLAKAAVRMNNWVEHLVLFKFNPTSFGIGSTKNAFNYLLDPENNTTILSENHRELIEKNLFTKEFNSANFVNDLKSFFKEFGLFVKNPLNYTHLLSRIIYAATSEWKEEVVALMASDGTGWQDERIEDLEDFDATIIWNSKRPSGTNDTLKFLRNIIKDGRSFNLYYSLGGNVNYKAYIIDFATNQQELDSKTWPEHYNILYFNHTLSNYADKNKSAKIVFLTNKLEKIKPIAVSEFEFYNGYDIPRQDNLSPIKYEPETEVIPYDLNTSTNENMNLTNVASNQILYGPPGTGKTYNTVNKALEAIGEDITNKDRPQLKQLFNEKVKEGQIVFTTFHQSLSYEDFIEGIKPIEPKQEGQAVSYRIVDGIFKKIAAKARENKELSELKTNKNLSAPFDLLFERLKSEIDNALLTDPVETENEKKKGLVLDLPTSFFSITGINGTSIRMMTRTGNEQNTMTKPTLQVIYENPDSLEQVITGGMRTYYRALVSIMKKWEADIKTTAIKVKPLNYVLIIDEINRGNVSQIFGELITLIEDDKRLGKEEALEATLPYSKEKFGVPPNLYIIGTMNTADRSVEALDAALRRRFCFEEMQPNPDKVRTDGKAENGIVDGIDLPLLLTTMNKRIEKLLDKDHQIGHSYFIPVASMADLQAAFQYKIIPLLQEYFFGDYGKIGLVLGNGFVEKEKEKEDTFFAAFDEYEASEFAERPIFKIKNIWSQHDEETFKEAINILLKK